MCDRRLTIEMLVAGIGLTAIAGVWMALTAGVAAPLWIPVGAICSEFFALHEVMNDDFMW